ncbi:dockerin type I domain-containing protein, partial [Stieleria sp.]|uniref:dockerin type I domain-containing protein n=1 Tax=Stieleria sp. TaxID=2795976 RepID=UPI003563E5A1
ISYDADGAVDTINTIQPHLGGTRQMLSAPITGTLADQPHLYSFTITEGELRSSPTQSITIGVDVENAVGELLDLTAGTSVTNGSRTTKTFTIDQPGTYRLLVSGAQATSYTVNLYVAGDLNQDNQIDAADQSLFSNAFGSTVGQPTYLVAADADRDGDVDQVDQVVLQTGYGWIANQAPAIEVPTGAMEIRGDQVLALDVTALASDPESDPVYVGVSAVSGVDARVLGSGLVTLRSTSAIGQQGTLELVADDFVLSSNPRSLSTTTVAAGFVKLDVGARERTLRAGDVSLLVLQGVRADGSVIELLPAEATFTTSDSDVAIVTDRGLISAGDLGTTVITVSAAGLSAAVAIEVGERAERLVEFFPLSYAMQSGQSRQIVVRERLPEALVDLSGAGGGSVYIPENPSIVTVDSEGTLTAVSEGTTRVTVINGGRAAVIDVLVASPTVGTVSIDASGGLVADGTGIVVGVPGGAIDTARDFAVQRTTENDLPYTLPAGFNFAAGVSITGDETPTELPLSVAIPAPATASAGDQFYLMQPVDVVLEGGVVEQSWRLVDSMVVGDDGVARTTSPPNIGVGARSWNNDPAGIFKPSAVASYAMVTPDLTGFLALRNDVQIREKQYNDYSAQRFAGVVSFDQATGPDAGDPEKRFYATAGPFGDYFLPVVAEFDYDMGFHAAQPEGLVLLETNRVRVSEGETIQRLFPLKPRLITATLTAPTINSAEILISSANEAPRLILKGQNFLFESPYADAGSLGTKVSDLFVTFEIGGRDTFDTDGKVLPVGGLDYRVDGSLLTGDDQNLVVPIPQGVLVGASTITVSRPNNAPLDGKFGRQIYTSNPASPVTQGRYAFVPSGGKDTITVYDLFATQPYQGADKLVPKAVAVIPLGVGRDDGHVGGVAPRHSVVSPDGTRVYVTLQRSGEIAVIDAVALQEADMLTEEDPRLDEAVNKEGVQPIGLPPGAQPFDAAIDPQGHYLFVSDYRNPNVYVVDINPYSPTFHMVVDAIDFPAREVPRGLRGIAVEPDGSALMVTAPSGTIFENAPVNRPGKVLRVDLTPLRDANTRKLVAGSGEQSEAPPIDGRLIFDKQRPDAVTEVGPNPYDITATDEVGVFLIVDRSASSEGFGVLRRNVRAEVFDYDFVDLNPFGRIPRLVEGRGTQAFGVRNAQSVAFVPANLFKDALGEDHPSYAFITGFNKFRPGDPISDPSLGVFDAYNPLFEQWVDGRRISRSTISESIVAGGNVGIIRKPTGDFDSLVNQPRLVAATRPIEAGFPDNVAVSQTTGIALASFTARDSVFGYDATATIRLIEEYSDRGVLDAWGQYLNGEPPENSIPELSTILRGPLSTVPIDAVSPQVAIAGDFRFFSDSQSGGRPTVGYGVPPKDPFGNGPPNLYAPLGTDRAPRGVSIQPKLDGNLIGLAPTPYNQSPSLQSYPNQAADVETGIQSAAEIQTGAFHETHSLVTYQSQGQNRGLNLHYDSLRAETRLIHYFALANANAIDRTGDPRLAVTLSARNADAVFEANAKPSDALLKQLRDAGLSENTFFTSLPKSIDKESHYGIGIPFDLSEAASGLYTLSLDYQIVRQQGGRLVAERVQTQTEPLAVVNSRKGIFGAGWGLEGYMELFEGDSGVLLVDGNGTEQMFLAPQELGQPYTPIALDYSELRQDADGRFTRRMLDGTVYEFDEENRLAVVRDRHGNETVFEHSGLHLVSVTDPVGLVTTFSYTGDRVTKITDPAGRETTFAYAGDQLVSITDPDDTTRTFQYDAMPYEPDPQARPLTGLITSQVFKRGNAGDPLDDKFRETVSYDGQGRVSGGARIDKLEFSLRPSQTFAVLDVPDASAFETAPRLELLAEPMSRTQADRPEAAKCGVDPDDNGDATLGYRAQATYIDFRGNEIEYEVTGFGQLSKVEDELGVVRRFDRSEEGGQILAEIDGLGNVVCFVYDVFGNMVKQTDFPGGPDSSIGVSTEYEFDLEKNNQLVSITESISQGQYGRKTVHTLNAVGDAIVVTTSVPSAPEGNPDSTTKLFSYTTSGLPTSVTDGEGNVVMYTYDTFERMDSTVFSDGQMTFTYDGIEGNLASTIDPAGDEVRMTYDPMNRILTTTNVLDDVSYVSTSEYDAEGNPVRQSDRIGTVTTFAYDVLNRPIERVDDAGGLHYTTRFGYDLAGLSPGYAVQQDPSYSYRVVRNPRGFFTAEVYDKHNLLIHSYDELGRETTFTYDAARRHEDDYLPGGIVIDRTLDGRGRVVREVGPTVEVSHFTHDNLNRLTQVISENDATADHVTQYEYNVFDLVGLEVDPEGHFRRTYHDRAGNPTRVIEAAESSEPYFTEYEYDSRNRVETINYNGAATEILTYFADGNLETRTDTRGFTSTFAYDAMDRQITITNAENEVTSFFYDGNGNLVGTVDGRGGGDRENAAFRSTMVYDGLNRKIESIDPLGNTTTYTYDAVGNLLTETDPRGDDGSGDYTSTYIYDALNRLERAEYPTGVVSEFEFDAVGYTSVERTFGIGEVAVNSNETRYLYDQSGRLRKMTDGEGYVTQYDYDQIGNLIRLTDVRGAAYRTEYEYDLLNREIKRTIAPNSLVEAIWQTAYNPIGLIDQTTDPTGLVIDLEYDSLKNLSTRTRLGLVDQFVYDAGGNLIAQSDPRGQFYTVNYDYDKVGRLVREYGPTGTPGDPVPYEIINEYDDAGNLISQSDPRNSAWRTTYEYDAAGRMVRETDAMGFIAHIEYDAAGNQIELRGPRSDSGTDSRYVVTQYFDGLNQLIGVTEPADPNSGST